MKSTKKQLINRGYLPKGAEHKYFDISFDEKIKLLQSKIPADRTLGARLSAGSKDSKTVVYLINALKFEKKLYTKIEICNTLVSFGLMSVKPLTAILGIIGTNQHKTVPEKEFKKDNYPLPRDIAGRTLAKIGKIALPELVKVLKNGNEKQISEAVDAVGFICFYESKSEIYSILTECYLKHTQNNLIKWKIIRAMSGFSESITFLQEQKQIIENDRLRKEIKRSLSLIKKN